MQVDSIGHAYGKSKVLAEQAAWDFVAEKRQQKKPCFELAVVHPTFVLGPMLSSAQGESASRFISIFRNKVDTIPNVYWPTCDVR